MSRYAAGFKGESTVRPFTNLLNCLLSACLCASVFSATVSAESAIENHAPEVSVLDNAIERAQANTALSDEERAALQDQYRQAKGYLNGLDTYILRARKYEEAIKSASNKADQLKEQLEADTAAFSENPPAPPGSTDLAAVELRIDRDKAEFAAVDARLSDLNNQLQTESERPAVIRDRLTGLKQKQEELATSLKLISNVNDDDVSGKAELWLQQTHSVAVRQEIKTLELELQSQPARVELLKAEQKTASFKRKTLEAVINLYELHAIKLHQGAAEKAQTEARSAELDAMGKHPLIRELAGKNAALSEQATELASKLEAVKGREAAAVSKAERFETDLNAVKQKLEIIGMSQALGQILREQQAKLPDSRFSRSAQAKRGQAIAESSLRQLEFEEEADSLRSIKGYVAGLTEALDEQARDEVAADLTELAKARRDLIKRTLEVESAYSRSMNDLDRADGRLRVAADAYSDFISQRLIWIRTQDALSLSTITSMPAEVKELLSPSAWLDLVSWLVPHVLSTPLYLILLVIVAAFWLSKRRLREALRASSRYVGDYRHDRFSFTLAALGLSMLVALVWPITLWSLGFIIGGYAEQSSLAGALSRALTRVSLFFYGFELLRQLLREKGLVESHFRWDRVNCINLRVEVSALEKVFLPFAMLGIVCADLHPREGGSSLSMFMIIGALLAMARFFYRVPKHMEGRFNHMLATDKERRSPMWGNLFRWAMAIAPCILIVVMLMGYGGTAIVFLGLLISTNALIVMLLLIQETGMRWFRIVRRRIVAQEAERDRDDSDKRVAGDEIFEEDFGEVDTQSLDDEGRKFLSAMLILVAFMGIAAIWSDVLPALGILDSVDLWSKTETLDGQEVIVPVTLADIGVAFLVGIVGWVIISRVPSLLEILLRQKMSVAQGSVYAVSTLFRYAVVTLVVLGVAGTLGGSWSQIQWAVAALSVGIGFGLQEIVANFISGIILLFEQPIRVGDTVTVGETSGVVTRIRMRATTIRDWDRRELLVPNKEFITGRLLNWSLSDQLTRFEVVVGVAYGTDLKKAMNLAVEVARSHADVLDDPEPFVTFDDFGDNSLKLVLRCFLSSVDRRLSTSSAVRIAVNERFNQEGIVIAFPQRDVHLDTSAPLEISLKTTDPS